MHHSAEVCQGSTPLDLMRIEPIQELDRPHCCAIHKLATGHVNCSVGGGPRVAVGGPRVVSVSAITARDSNVIL